MDTSPLTLERSNKYNPQISFPTPLKGNTMDTPIKPIDPVDPTQPVDPVDTQDSGHGDPPPKHPPSEIRAAGVFASA